MQMEHNYSKPWNGKPENSLIKQTKVVFKNSNSIYHEINDENSPDFDRIIVDDEPSFQRLTFDDQNRNRTMMSESESQANIAKPNSEYLDWEDKISKINWTYYQNYLFDKMVAILNKDRIARLTYTGHKNEPIFRKTIIESSVKRARSLFGAVFWDLYLVQWLHVLLIQNLNSSYLTIYLDILKGLRRKLPEPLDRMITVPSNVISKYNTFSPENLKNILNEDWTPINENILFGKVKSLPTNSVILLIPSSPATYQSQYTKKWNSLLSVLTTVVIVDYAQANEPNLNMMQSADNMIVLIRNKLNEIRSEHINKNIILVGLGSTGSAFACQIAVVEHNISCVVCLGFATRTANGFRGEPDDCIVDIQCPILFIIGQNSNKTSHMDMEDLREKLKTETGLVIVSNADDNLRVSHKKCLDDLITQEYVLKKILGEISDFVTSLLSSTSLASSLSSLSAAGASTSLPIYSSGPTKSQTITIDIDQLNRQKDRKRSYHEISYPCKDIYQPKQKKVHESKDKIAKPKYKERKNAKNQYNLQKQNVGTKTTAISLMNSNMVVKSTKKSNVNTNARPNQSFYISSVGNNRYVYTSDDGINATAATHYANHDNIEYIFSLTDNTISTAATEEPTTTRTLKSNEYYISGTDYIEIIE